MVMRVVQQIAVVVVTVAPVVQLVDAPDLEDISRASCVVLRVGGRISNETPITPPLVSDGCRPPACGSSNGRYPIVVDSIHPCTAATPSASSSNASCRWSPRSASLSAAMALSRNSWKWAAVAFAPTALGGAADKSPHVHAVMRL